MRITKLHITSFGKLEDFTLEFTDGFNLVYGENEYGKSTIMAFIDMMFYGKPAGSKGGKDISKNMRLKYMPWNGSKMDGSIEFEYGGDSYRMEKTWGKSEKSDKLSIYKNGTEEVNLPVGEDPGNVFFEMDAEAFERSIYIGSEYTFTATSTNDSIAEKISNMSASGDETVSTDKVMKKLTSAREALISKSGRTGEIPELKAKIDELNDEYLRISSIEKEQSGAREEYNRIVERIAELKKEQENRNKRIRFLYLEELINLENTYDELKQSVYKYMPAQESQRFISENEILADKASRPPKKLPENMGITEDVLAQGRKLEDAVKEADYNKKTAKDRLDRAKSEISANEAEHINENTSESPMFIILAIIVGVLSVAAGIFITPVLLAGLAVAALLVYLYMNVRKASANDEHQRSLHMKEVQAMLENAQKEYDEACKNAAASKQRLDDLLGKYNSSGVEMLQKSYIEYEKNIAVIRTSNEDIALAGKQFMENMKIFGEVTYIEDAISKLSDYKNKLSKVRTKKDELDTKKKVYGYSNKSVSQLVEEQIECSESGLTEENIDLLKSQNVLAESELSRLHTAQRQAAEKIKSIDSNPETILREISTDKEQLVELEHNYKVADIACNVMEDTINEIRQSFGPELNRKTSDILSDITGGVYDETMVHKDYKVQVMSSDKSHYRDYAYLSNGTIDQVYLALRLAIIKLAYEDKENMPLFMDDILAQYDDERTEKTMNYLKKYSENGQVVMFTCHGHIRDAAEEL